MAKTGVVWLNKGMKLDLIIKEITSLTGLDITEKNRSLDYFYARSIYCYIARNYTSYSLAHIANKVNITHASVLNCIKRFEYDMNMNGNDDLLKRALFNLKLSDEGVEEVEVEEETYALPRYILNDLRSLNPEQQQELYNTRIKPFIAMLNSRESVKEIKEPMGALIRIRL